MRILTLNDRIRAHSKNAGHAVEIPAGARQLFCNGQVGLRLDGTVAETSKEQLHIIFERIGIILEEAGMSYQDIAKFTVYVADKAIIEEYLEIRDEYLGAHSPPATLLVVNPFPRPGILVEIEAMAAKVDD